MSIIYWNKKDTETLATTLKRFRIEYPEYQRSKITYAGRLDPMAEGLLILLTDEDVYKKEEYIGMDKIYDVDFILGVETDSYDILGLIQSVRNESISEEDMVTAIHALKHIKQQSYPSFSSKTIQGKPLFQWMREGKIDSLDIPHRSVNIYMSEYLGKQVLSLQDFQDSTLKRIQLVQGDFRQNECILAWQDYFKNVKAENVIIYTMRIHASSGTYMRSLVNYLGKVFQTGACTIGIRRLQIGEHKLAKN